MKERNEIESLLREFYRDQPVDKPSAPSAPFRPSSIHNSAPGLGDAIILTGVMGSIPQVKVNSQVLLEIADDRLEPDSLSSDPGLCISQLAQHDWLGGHAIQRFQRALGLPVETKPAGKIRYNEAAKIKNRVFVHLTNNTDWKRALPNSLSPAEIELVNQFFIGVRPDLEPVFYGNDLSLSQLINEIETCEYFLGIDSGPMHVAAALNLKSVVIINDPLRLIWLPKIKECSLPNAEWLYPQNSHLNRAGETQLVPGFNLESLAKAFAGEVYPYWSTQYLDITG